MNWEFCVSLTPLVRKCSLWRAKLCHGDPDKGLAPLSCWDEGDYSMVGNCSDWMLESGSPRGLARKDLRLMQCVIPGILWREEVASFRKYNFLKVGNLGEILSHWDLCACLFPVEKCGRECLSWGIMRPEMQLNVFGTPVVLLFLGNYIPGILLGVQ